MVGGGNQWAKVGKSHLKWELRGGYQIDQVVDRLQKGRFRKTEKPQPFQSLEASFPLLSLLNSFSLLIKIYS